MRTSFLKTMLAVVSLSFLLIYCKKSSDIKTDTYMIERQWVHENGGVYKNENLTMKSPVGEIKKASLNWSAARKYIIGETHYTEIPYLFSEDHSSAQTNGVSDDNVTFSFMIRTFHGKTEAAVKFSHRKAKIKNANSEKTGIIEGYSSLDGTQLNMWFTDSIGKLMSMRKQNSNNITVNAINTKTVNEVRADCAEFTVNTYEYKCWITGGAYDDVACGWLVVGSTQYLICVSSGGGGDDWPPSGSGTPPTNPPSNTPCPGDAIANPTIAPSSLNNKNGGRFGPTRKYPDGSPKMHKGIDLSAVPNTPVYAAFAGVVVRSISFYAPNYYGGPTSFGNLVEIETTRSNGTTFTTLYGHLNSASVSVNSTVNAGDQIGVSGRTGNAQKVPYPHVHLQIRQNGVLVDPEPFLATKFDNQGNSTGRPCQ